MKISPILRCASWLAPAEEREEWLAEWGGELAFVRHTCSRTRALAFCLGAIPDALWLRRNHPPAAGWFHIESPARCLLLLASLAAAGTYFILRSPELRGPKPQPYLDADRLTMVSHYARGGSRFADIPLAEYQARAEATNGPFEAVAFYVPCAPWVRTRRFALAIASPNLFRMLGVPVPGSGLILTRSAWRRYFDRDPNIVGQTVDVYGKPATVTAIIPDSSWRLPGFMDGWLLDPERLAQLPAQTNGFMVARLHTTAQSNIRVPMATPNEHGTFSLLTFSPLPEDNAILTVILLVGIALILLPATTSLSLGEFPASCHSPRWTARIRWWLFFGVKVLLLPPIVFGAFVAIGVLPVAPQGAIVSLVLALRWVLQDQRRRCPVCLRALSHPVRIGEASHMFLAWYGTELLCTRGHGWLHVPEIPTSSYAEPRWLYLEAG